MRYARVGVVGAVAAVVFLSGCAQGAGTDLSEQPSPLEEYMSVLWGTDLSPEEQEKEFAAQEMVRQEAIAQCMQDEGFDYVPVDNSQYITYSDDDTTWDPDNREWVSQYGYGYVNYPMSDEPAVPEDEAPADPNWDYYETLTPSEQQAYDALLYGEQPTEEEMEDPNFDWESLDSGCQGAAYEEQTDPAMELYESEEFAPLFAAMDELYTKSQESPEMKELNAAWAECMAEGGEPGFTEQWDAQQSISDEQNAFWDAYTWDESDPDADPMKEPEMVALAEREVELALVDLECREKTDFSNATTRIMWDLEEQFVAENKAALDALKAAAEQAAG